MMIEHNIVSEVTSDAQFIRDFENDLDPARPFRHMDHVRLAFAYLSVYPVLQALDRFSSALKRFAETRGKTQLYHESITYAYFFLIHERMARFESTTGGNIDWQEFSMANSDLLVWKNGILESYYAKNTLESELARRVFILPDKSVPNIPS